MPTPMWESTSNPEAGQKLRAERLRARLTTRAVQDLSQKIAVEKGNQDYYVSHAWLTEAEGGKCSHNIHKFYSLSLIYKCNLLKILGFFGIDLRDLANDQRLVSLPHTHLIGTYADVAAQSVVLPAEFRKELDLTHTNLVSQVFQSWGGIPTGLLGQIDIKNRLCGYIGLEDYSMYPFLRPGSIVEIDERQKNIRADNWRDEYDRPIYFVELRDRFACGWCEVDGSQLVLIPSVQSRGQIRHLQYPNEADIIGRITAAVMPLVPKDNRP